MVKNKKTVIALGYFDSVHIGHRSVLAKAKQVAEDMDAEFVVFSFKGDLRKKFNENDKAIYDADEREELYYELGADYVYFAPLTKSFLAMSGLSFLNSLNREFDICAYVCGADYKFGENASFGLDYLKQYAVKKKQAVHICDIVTVDGEKVSTARIKELLMSGNVEKANKLLVSPFSVFGTVKSDRGEGGKLGFPTANIRLDESSVLPKDGVYAGHIKIGLNKYKILINLGSRPTFGVTDRALEVHVIGFNGNLYGKKLAVHFDKFIRDIKKFSAIEELKKQIENDLEEAKKC